MKQFVSRDYGRTEHDDWQLNVQPRLSPTTESVAHERDGHTIGWLIIGRYE